MNKKLTMMVLGVVVLGLIIFAGYLIYQAYLAPTSTSNSPEITGTRWYVDVVDGDEAPTEAYVEFADGSNVTGFGGCNGFSGNYTLTGSTIDISAIASTKIACEADVDAFEVALFQALENADKVTVEESTLFMNVNGSNIVLSSRGNGVIPEDLVGDWNYSQTVLEGEAIPVVAGTTVKLKFTVDGKVSGTACNSFGGNFAEVDDVLVIRDLVQTEMACTTPEGVMEQESDFLSDLSEVSSYEITDGTLKLFVADNVYLEFVK